MRPRLTLGFALAMKQFLCLPFVFLGSILLGAATPETPPKEAGNAIEPAGLLEHIKVLSSDQFEGRAPGSEGEEKSVRYITSQFQKIGLKPGNPNGSYIQEVPMAGILTAPPPGSQSENRSSNCGRRKNSLLLPSGSCPGSK